MNQLLITTRTAARLAFRFPPKVVRAMIPSGVIACYVLMAGDRPIYVGRSDGCLQRRLATHDLLGTASHFIWQPCRNPLTAFHLESALYHSLRDSWSHDLLNAIHPDRPQGDTRICPFCVPADRESLEFAFERQRS